MKHHKRTIFRKTISRKWAAGFKLGFVICVGGLLVSACGLYEEYTPDDDLNSDRLEEIDWEKQNTIFGKGGLNFFGSKTPENTGWALGVNSFLWRASLDTISFMPVNSADPFGGVILTDWHTPNEAPSERFKLNVYILDRTLRADGVRVAVFRQVQDRNGNWRDAGVPGGTGTKIEDAILIRARQLRNQSLSK
jgi:hypothetical protein